MAVGRAKLLRLRGVAGRSMAEDQLPSVPRVCNSNILQHNRQESEDKSLTPSLPSTGTLLIATCGGGMPMICSVTFFAIVRQAAGAE